MAVGKHKIVLLRTKRDSKPYIACLCGGHYMHDGMLAPAYAENTLLDWYNAHKSEPNGSR